jgi:hypothetical protein
MRVVAGGRSTSVRAGRSTHGIAREAHPLGRRRAALGHAGHAITNGSGFDGELFVRYDAVHGRAEPASAERRLLLAVLEDGIRALLKNADATCGRAFNLRREALGWLLMHDRTDVFAFESICETLGIDPARLRGRVLAAAHQGLHAVH